jgi:hypothetical protein
MNLPFEAFIFSNPDWVSLPIRIWVGGVFLILFLLSLRYGPSGAVNIAGRFRWVFLAALVPAAAWGLYGSIVLGLSSAMS